MNRKLALFILMVGLLASPILAASNGNWLHVRVEGSGNDGERISVNIPLSLVEAILPTISTNEFHGGRIHLGNGTFDEIDLHEILRAFRDSPDADFVTIDDGDETVRVSKERGMLLVDVDGDGERVRVRLPLDVVEALLGGAEDELDLLSALTALANHGGGDLVTVDSDNESIRVWIDNSDDGR